jgi:hypothetical protein
MIDVPKAAHDLLQRRPSRRAVFLDPGRSKERVLLREQHIVVGEPVNYR